MFKIKGLDVADLIAIVVVAFKVISAWFAASSLTYAFTQRIPGPMAAPFVAHRASALRQISHFMSLREHIRVQG